MAVHQSTLLKMSFYDILCLQAINYRMLQKDKLPLKIELLYSNTTFDGSGIYGWRDEAPAEVVSIDNEALYKNPHLRTRGIYDKASLLAAHKQYWEGELARSKDPASGLPKHYGTVCQKKLDTEQTHVLIGGIHRMHVYPTVVAMWMDNDVPFTDEVPVQVGVPKSYEELRQIQHLRNALGSSQVELLDIDLVASACDALASGRSNTEFRHWVALGYWPRKGEEKAQGKAIQCHWYAATLNNHFLGLKILDRLFIDPSTTVDEDKKRWIDFKKLRYVPKFGGSQKSNLMRALFCGDELFRSEYRSTPQGKSAPPAGSEEEKIEQGLMPTWSVEKMAQWVDARCPHNPAFSGMDDVKPVTVDVERVKRLNRDSVSHLVRDVAGALLIDPNTTGTDNSGAFSEMIMPFASALDAAYRLLRHPAYVAKATELFVNLDTIAASGDVPTVMRLFDDLNEVVSKPKASPISETKATEPVVPDTNKPPGKKKQPVA